MRVFVWGSKQGREKGALKLPFSGCPPPQAIKPCGWRTILAPFGCRKEVKQWKRKKLSDEPEKAVLPSQRKQDVLTG